MLQPRTSYAKRRGSGQNDFLFHLCALTTTKSHTIGDFSKFYVMRYVLLKFVVVEIKGTQAFLHSSGEVKSGHGLLGKKRHNGLSVQPVTTLDKKTEHRKMKWPAHGASKRQCGDGCAPRAGGFPGLRFRHQRHSASWEATKQHNVLKCGDQTAALSCTVSNGFSVTKSTAPPSHKLVHSPLFFTHLFGYCR